MHLSGIHLEPRCFLWLFFRKCNDYLTALACAAINSLPKGIHLLIDEALHTWIGYSGLSGINRPDSLRGGGGRRKTYHCYIENLERLGFDGSEKAME